MAVRATKRGEERTPLEGDFDVIVCGASFGGLAVARELTGSGARTLVLDRYEIGERQTSACGIPTEWMRALGLMEAELQRFGTLVVHTMHGTARYRLPWTFSTFDYRRLCELLWRDCDAEFETAKVNGRLSPAPGDGRVAIDTDRGVLSAELVVDALGWRRMLALGAGYQPPEAPMSRGLEVHPPGTGTDLEVWVHRRYVPAGYAWCFPARDELRIGIGSFDPRFHVRDSTELLSADLDRERVGYQGNWIPHKLRNATEGGVFFVGDSAGHCLPLTAEGIRTAIYFGIAAGREMRAVVEGRQAREQALTRYAAFHDSHEQKFRWMLRVQRLLPKLHPRVVWPALRLLGTKPLVNWSFAHYRRVAPAEFAAVSADHEHRPRQQQEDADYALGAERDLVQAEQA